jgi:alpha/beta superfamily hydrolase
MNYKLLFRVAKVFQALGFAVLRFNFRGVGLSEGTHNDGQGEQDDVRAALDWLEQELPGRPIVSGGFSFGAVMALRVGDRDPRVAALLAMGLPVDVLPRTHFVESIEKPKLFIQGELDPFGDAAAIESLLERVPEPKELVVIPGSDHFFAGKIEAVEAAVSNWAPRAIAS